MTLKINADSIRFISNVSPGRIVKAEVEPFESLSKNGRMHVIVANTGRISAQYSVSVSECSPNILPVVARSISLASSQTQELVFDMVSSAELGSVANFCFVQLRNVEAVVLDRVRVDFNTSDVIKSAGAQSGNAPNETAVSSPPPSGPDLVCGQCAFFDLSCSIANSCTLNLLKSIGSVVLPLGVGLLLLKVRKGTFSFFFCFLFCFYLFAGKLLCTPSVQTSLARCLLCRRRTVYLEDSSEPDYVVSPPKRKVGMLSLVN